MSDKNLRHDYDELLVGVALENRLRLETLRPGLLDDFHARSSFGLVQCDDLVKLDLAIEKLLKGRLNVIAVVVGMTAVVVVMM